METIKHNPHGWRWRLVLWLTGGEIEAVPLLPRRPISATEDLRIHLGWEGHLNTVEVKSMVNQTTELLPIEDPETMMMPGTFVAIDVDDPKAPDIERIVGTFINWRTADTMVIELPGGDSRRTVDVPLTQCAQAYWAPVGYRP